jgi:hypothetical protein
MRSRLRPVGLVIADALWCPIWAVFGDLLLLWFVLRDIPREVS